MKKLLVILSLLLPACSGASSWPGYQVATAPVTTYTITPTADANGTISPPTVQTVTSGGFQAFSMSCNSGYQLASVTTDTGSVAVSSPYTFTNVVANHTITFTCSVVSVPSSIAAVQATYVAMAVRGTPHYFCDCGTNASSSCIAGSDSNDGLTTSTPKQTIAAAISTLNAFPSGTANTVALCKGGAFNSTAQNQLNNSNCIAGSTCFDLREYTPTTFTGSAKPIINNATGNSYLFKIVGSGGFRIMNLRLQGTYDTVSGGNFAVFAYSGAHDIVIGNNEMDGFDIALDTDNGGTSPINNILLTGNTITNSSTQGMLGGGINFELSYNYFDGNGGSNVRDHSVYLSTHVGTGMRVIGNYLHGQYGPTCNGSMMVAHGEFDTLTVANNTIVQDNSTTTPGCYGIDFDNGGYPIGVWFRNAVFSGNTVINSGAAPLTVMGCPACVIEDNLIISDAPNAGGITGIYAPLMAARTSPADDVMTAATIVNNTIWVGPNNTWGSTGINVGIEGTGYIIANNSVTILSTTMNGQSHYCFNYGLATSAYAFINNNHCYTSVTSAWEKNNGATLAAWRTYSSGFDSASLTTAPNFVTPSSTYGAYNFHPNTGSPLISAGSHANAPVNDLTGTAFGNPPDIGDYKH